MADPGASRPSPPAAPRVCTTRLPGVGFAARFGSGNIEPIDGETSSSSEAVTDRDGPDVRDVSEGSCADVGPLGDHAVVHSCVVRKPVSIEELLSALHDEGLAAVVEPEGIVWNTGNGWWRITDGDAGVDFNRPEAVFCATEFNDIEETSRTICYVKALRGTTAISLGCNSMIEPRGRVSKRRRQPATRASS
jgi:hypothetical protein